MTRLSLAACLLIALAAHAQESADLSVTAFPNPVVVGADTPMDTEFTVMNNGPSTARGVKLVIDRPVQFLSGYVLGLDGMNCTREGVCTVDTLAPGRSVRGHVGARSGFDQEIMFVTAEASADTPDPDASNNRARASISVVSHPQLSTSLVLRTPAYPGGRGTIEVSFRNYGTNTAHNVRLTVAVPEGTVVKSYTSEGANMLCDVAARPVVCTVDALPRMNFSGKVVLNVIAPADEKPGSVPVTAEIATTDEEDKYTDNTATAQWLFVRLFTVTTTADDGPGSLRQLFLDVNAADCTNDCLAGFRIPGPLPPSGYFTIQPRSPLPAVTASHMTLLGSTEADILDVPLTKPLVMIDGSLQPSGDGLRIMNSAHVTDVAIGNFPDAGVRVGGPGNGQRALGIERSWIGVDATGNRAAPNLRGVVGEHASYVQVSRCVVSGNIRSGIFGDAGTVDVANSRIGVAAADDTPIPNGATGIFAAWGAGSLYAKDNVIANNGEWGIATLPGIRIFDVERNLVHDNGVFNLDHSMDGADARAGDDSLSFPNAPLLHGARYDAARGKTILSFELTGLAGKANRWIVTIFAANGPRIEATKLLATFDKRQAPAQYEVELDGDWRGSYLTAQTRRSQFLGEGSFEPFELDVATSELSEPIPVE
jgi:uncharacterized repeat protein (TIGR01451 family)